MDPLTRNTITLGLAWSGPVFAVLFLIFFIILGHNLPPPNFMGMTAEQLISEYYLPYQNDIKLGMTGCTVVGLLYMVWSCVLASVMAKEESGSSVLSNLELAGGLLTGWLLAFTPAIWLACAVFLDAVEPAVIHLVHGFTWFIFDMTYMITTIQMLGVGLYTICNRQQSMFPVWAGWAAIAIGLMFAPLSLVPYVTSGPFTVAGTWNFFVVFGTWGFAYFCPYCYFLLKELYRQRRQLVGSASAQYA